MKYYLIYCDDDGEISITSYNREELLEEISDEDNQHLVFIGDICAPKNPAYLPDGSALIIKGEIVLPKPISRVKEWDIE